MHQIESCLRQRISHDIVLAYFQVRSVKSLKKACVDSVTTTRPQGPTRSLSHAAIDPPPPHTSRQCQPLEPPRSSRWRIVPASNSALRATKRSRAWVAEFSS